MGEAEETATEWRTKEKIIRKLDITWDYLIFSREQEQPGVRSVRDSSAEDSLYQKE